MARMPRVKYAGAIHHVTVRMVGHAWETGRGLDRSVCLFRDEKDRARFVGQLGERVEFGPAGHARAHAVRLGWPDAARSRRGAWPAKRLGGCVSTPAPHRPFRGRPYPPPPKSGHRGVPGIVNNSLSVICSTVPNGHLSFLERPTLRRSRGGMRYVHKVRDAPVAGRHDHVSRIVLHFDAGSA